MTHLLLPGMLEQQGAAGAFDPTTSITWHACWFIEDNGYSYSDGNDITAWDDTVNGWTLDAASGTSTDTPTYDAINAAYNNQPVADFTGTGKGALEVLVADGYSVPTYPISIVCIGSIDTGETYSCLFDGSAWDSRNYVAKFNSSSWTQYGGFQITGGTNDNSPHLFVAYHSTSGNETLDVDGSQVASGNGGSYTIHDGFRVGGMQTASTSFLADYIGFVAIYEGDFTADGSYSDFCTWAENHYGLTIA